MSSSSSKTEMDWQMDKSVLKCNKYMLEEQLQCDVTFRVGTEGATEDIKAHKYVIISDRNYETFMVTHTLQRHKIWFSAK